MSERADERGSDAVTAERHADPPAWRVPPAEHRFSAEFLELRDRVYARIEPYYDRDHLTRAGDWMLCLEPVTPEHRVLAALIHDPRALGARSDARQRSVPGGPVHDKARMAWDDETYNRAHCERSVDVVSDWLRRQGASEAIVQGVRQPIREHEFGGSPEGDLMHAADSISFLETNGSLIAGWVRDGECSLEKGREKLRWMYERVRLV